MKARYFDLMDYDDIFYPSFFSVAYGDERMNYGFSYFRQFSQYIQSDPIPMTTVDQPEGTGEFLQFSTDVDIQSYAGTAQYALSNKIGIGMTVGGNYLTNRDELGRNYVTVSGWSFLAITGVHAKFDELTVGASVRYSSPFSSWNEETKLKLIRVLEPTGEIITTKYFARLPIVYQVGISYQIQPSFRISVSDEIQDWSFVGLQYKEISNIHIGITATVSEYLDLLLGYSEQFDAQNGVTDLKFFTAGITVHAELITFTAGVSDSKMFSKTKVPWYSYPPKEPFRQFILLSGLTYSF
ncbi:MAG: hypothetical protein HYV29_15950 [Ignavibacteriales bacterium]|nr:hypothetical protein [Ignavibacteriales bacterium]